MAKLGLSFSGGGVRSAAFCSGVLRRLLQKDVAIDYLSCVSGGGYAGTAYLDWKYRHGKKDNKKWHQQFFDHMREGAGLICHFQKPCLAALEFVAIFAILLFVTLLAPFLLWSPYAFPLAYIIDFAFGSILRGGSPPCPVIARNNPNITLEKCLENRRESGLMERRFALFAIPVFVALISYALKGFFQRGQGVFSFIAAQCITFFGLVFFPWFIHEFLRSLPNWMKILIVLPTFFIWISFPLMRKNATLLIVVYAYSFVIHIRVYQNNTFGFEYDDKAFNLMLGVSTLLMWISPLIGTIQQNIGHMYVRYVCQVTSQLSIFKSAGSGRALRLDRSHAV